MGTELVFSVMDFVVGGLLMIVTFIWFRSKHIARFYDACKNGDLESVEKFLDPSQGWLSRLSSKEACVGLMWAASGDQVEVVTRLMGVHTIFRHQSSLASCLMCAVKRGHVATVRRLVAEPRVPLDIANKAGVAPINFTEDKEIRNIIQTEAARRQAIG